MSVLPDFQMSVAGEYYGNPYPQAADYLVRIVQINDGTEFVLTVENSSGGEVNVMPLTEADADGIFKVAATDHSLSGYEDDWKIPPGIERSVRWDLGDGDNFVQLAGGEIDEVATWLRYALAIDEYTGPSDSWEY